MTARHQPAYANALGENPTTPGEAGQGTKPPGPAGKGEGA